MRLCLVLTICFSFLGSAQSEKGQRVLNDYIRHYEELNYDVTDLHNRHQRAKRSADKSLDLKFSAFGKNFHLDLWPSDSVFSHDHKSRQLDGTESHVDTSFIYDGTVRGVAGSSVHGAILDGQFQGLLVNSQEEIYFIEPASRYFRRPASSGQPHSVIYREDHMNLDPYRHKRAADGHHGSCGLDKYKDWMTSQSEAAYGDPRKPHDDVTRDNLYSKDSNTAFSRRKRNACYSDARRTCNLYLRADPVLFNETMTRLGGNVVSANNEILALFSTHVFAINNIYKNTKFETFPPGGFPCFDGMNFRIQRTTIMTDESLLCNSYLRTTALSFCNPNIDVSNFLNLNSMDNHDEFCLAYVFTYRDFSGGTLGLAWVGSPSAAAGGVCERFKTIREQGRSVQKSLNTGIVTLINYGQRVPPRVSQITFAHEVGHNYGSPHDSGSECAPGGDAGNFIMYPSATKGNRPNNELFSKCSKDNITRVLNSVVQGLNGKTNCFTVSDEAFCGNGIVEKGEQCDCGYKDDCKDDCCNPRDTSLSPAADTLKCTLKDRNSKGQTVQCSPSQGPCCSPSCTFLPSNEDNVCRPGTDCSLREICDGKNATCPPVQKKKDMTYCNSFTQVCIDGVCQGSLCKRIGYNSSVSENFTSSWDECYFSGGEKDKERMCYLACQKGSNGTCFVSDAKVGIPDEFQLIINEVKLNKSVGGAQITVPAGTPCNSYRGYCDVFQKCRGVDNDGPLERLKNLIFGEETLSSIKDWIIEHWWAVMLIAIGVIIVMGAFIKVFSYNTPSEDPIVKNLLEKQNKQRNTPVKNPKPNNISRGGADRRDPRNAGPYIIYGGGADRRDQYNRKNMDMRRV